MAQTSGQGSPSLPGNQFHNSRSVENEESQAKDDGAKQADSGPVLAFPSGAVCVPGDDVDDNRTGVDEVNNEPEKQTSDMDAVDINTDYQRDTLAEPEPARSGDAEGLVERVDNADNEPVSKPQRRRRSPVSNVVNFPPLTGEQGKKKARLLTGEQKNAKRGKQKASALLLTGEQMDDLKPFLPTLETGFWWDAPADDKGFKIKLRWRDENKKQKSYVFARLGKHELNTLRKGSIYEQRADLYDRLTGELIEDGRSDLAERLTTPAENDQGFSRADSAIA